MNEWQINPTSCIHRKVFRNDSIILFDETSGQTHIVNELCADVFDILRRSHLSSMFLLERLAQLNDFSVDEEWRIYVDEMLAHLDQLGLIEPVMS